MTPLENIKDIFTENKNQLDFIKRLAQENITVTITGSSVLYINGDFGRKPNDLDLYTTQEDLSTIANLLQTNTVVKNFPPVSWIELEENKYSHVLAKLECNFENGSYYDFSLTDLVIENSENYILDNVNVKVVPPEEVLLLKLTAPRKSETKDDIADVKNYLENNQLNKEYFEKRAREIGVYEIVTKILEH